jgi:SAM-dependent methyltransferase
MCHDSDLAFVREEIARHEVEGKTVVEVGAFDDNGSARPHVESLNPESYVGIDMREGPRVDVVMDAADLPTLGEFDLVISTEMLEHAEDWRAATAGMIDAVKPGGILFLTTRSPGFAYHGCPEDHWRYSVDDMRDILTGAGLDILVLKPDPAKIYPGVFAKARKPLNWTWPEETGWENITLEKPICPS